jgi:hypothetical protein
MRIALALDQPRAHQTFQLLDLMRQRRRRDVESMRGMGKMLLFREHREIAKQPSFNVSHSLDVIE